MTTAQLIKVLKSYPPDVEVVAMWDSGWSDMDEHALIPSDPPVVEFNVSDYGSYERKRHRRSSPKPGRLK